MDVTRRRFLQVSTVLTAEAVLAPAWLNQLRASAATADPGASGGRKLLLVELSGGNDGLNTVVPYTDSTYYARRKKLAIPADRVLKLPGHDVLGLHPGLRAMHRLFAAGDVALVQGVGYDEPDLSHFGSMDVWQSGSPTHEFSTGWLGRWLDATAEKGGAIRAVSVGDHLPLVLRGDRSSGVVIPSLQRFTFSDGADAATNTSTAPHEPRLTHDAYLASSRARSDDPLVRAFRQSGSEMVTAVRRINRLQASGDEPESLADRVALADQLLASDLGIKIAHVSLGGFDHHAAQAALHDSLISELDAAIAQFVHDAHASKRPADHLMLVFSEFGRRLQQNGSAGTDHGTASTTFVIGTQVRGGVYGANPKLKKAFLDEDGNLRREVELREVYAPIVDRWLDGPGTREILGGAKTAGLHPIDFLV